MKSLLIATIALITLSFNNASDVTVEDLGDGYMRVTAPSYTVEVPQGWEVGDVTSYGSRDFEPQDGKGDFNVMTAPPSNASWEDTYSTALYFILRRNPQDKASAYELTKRDDGVEAATFVVTNPEGFAYRRFVMLKHPDKGLMALSVRIPSEDAEEQWEQAFARLVESATFAG